MGKTTMYIPDEHLMETIEIIEAGLERWDRNRITKITYDALCKWCDEGKEYGKQHDVHRREPLSREEGY